jgi:methylmalonyl-CoA carboxyltransferase 5S subunit
MLGYYGETLGGRDEEVVKAAEAHAKKPPIVGRPADLLKPEWDELRAKALDLEGCDGSDEDVLTYAMFPQVAPKFFKSRAEGPKNLGKDSVAAPKGAAAAVPKGGDARGPVTGPISYEVTVGGKSHKVTVRPA